MCPELHWWGQASNGYAHAEVNWGADRGPKEKYTFFLGSPDRRLTSRLGSFQKSTSTQHTKQWKQRQHSQEWNAEYACIIQSKFHVGYVFRAQYVGEGVGGIIPISILDTRIIDIEKWKSEKGNIEGKRNQSVHLVFHVLCVVEEWKSKRDTHYEGKEEK